MAEKKSILVKAFDNFRFDIPCHIGQGDDFKARLYTFYVNEIFKNVEDARLYAEILCPIRKQPFGKLADGAVMYRTVVEYYVPKLTGSDIEAVLRPKAAKAYQTHIIGKMLKNPTTKRIEETKLHLKDLLMKCAPSLRAYQRSEYLKFVGSLSHQEIVRCGFRCDSIHTLTHIKDYKAFIAR